MDRVRFGRALGEGARQTAKTLLSAAEAAAAPDPRRRASAESATGAGKNSRPPAGVTERNAAPGPDAAAAAPGNVTARAAKTRVDPRVVAAQAQTLKKSVWGPFAKFSSVLWLEVTGIFFAIFALIAGLQIWKFHAALGLSPASPDARRLYVYVVIFVVFGYFTVSSFVRAGRRQRR